MKTSATAPTIAAHPHRRRPVVLTASIMTVTPMLTAMTVTATATRPVLLLNAVMVSVKKVKTAIAVLMIVPARVPVSQAVVTAAVMV